MSRDLFRPTIKNPMKLSDDFDLPLQAAASRFAVLGKSGSGKSNGDTVFIEEMVGGGVPVVVLDVLGNMWGLRSSADGLSPGLSIAIFGGLHGDVPLRADRGAYIADMVAEGVTALLDLSRFDRDQQQDFVADFLPRLMARCRRNMHVVFEEADTFAPERPTSKSHARARSASTVFARTSRNSGIGWTMSTQRPQLLSKEVIDSADVLLAMKMTGDLAQAAIGAEVKSRAGAKLAAQIMTELPLLTRGSAWFVPDSDWLDDAPAAPQSFRFRWRQTFDSARPPKIGEIREEPKVLAPVDLELIREAMTAEPVEDETPADSGSAASKRSDAIDVDRRIAEADAAGFERGVRAAQQTALRQFMTVHEAVEQAEQALARIKRCAPMGTPVEGAPAAAVPASPRAIPSISPIDHPPPAEPVTKRSTPLPIRILDALAWWKAFGVDAPDRIQIGMVAGVKASGGHYMASLAELKSAGNIDYPTKGHVALTTAGIAIANPPAIPPTRAALIERAREVIADKSQLRIFDAVVAAETVITREQVAEAIGVAGTGGHFLGSISALVKVGLLQIPRRGCVSLSPIFNRST